MHQSMSIKFICIAEVSTNFRLAFATMNGVIGMIALNQLIEGLNMIILNIVVLYRPGYRDNLNSGDRVQFSVADYRAFIQDRFRHNLPNLSAYGLNCSFLFKKMCHVFHTTLRSTV